jgi:hypothetical protein
MSRSRIEKGAELVFALGKKTGEFFKVGIWIQRAEIVGCVGLADRACEARHVPPPWERTHTLADLVGHMVTRVGDAEKEDESEKRSSEEDEKRLAFGCGHAGTTLEPACHW